MQGDHFSWVHQEKACPRRNTAAVIQPKESTEATRENYVQPPRPRQMQRPERAQALGSWVHHRKN